MTPEQFIRQCSILWHVGPPGSWSRISREGLRTARQLIDAADLDDETRRTLIEKPRRNQVELPMGDDVVILRDQEPLFSRKDITPLLARDMTVVDWLGLLDRRVYLFAGRRERDILIRKYAARHGYQEVIQIDSDRLLEVAGSRVELADQNTGAIARVSHPYKDWNTFQSIDRFPNKRPKEVTVVDGLSPAEVSLVCVTVERVLADGNVQRIHK